MAEKTQSQLIVNFDLARQLFDEFIQFAYNELQTEGWRGRMNELCEYDEEFEMDPRERESPWFEADMKRINMTIPELVESMGSFEDTIMLLFTKDLLEHNWFHCWLKQQFPNMSFIIYDTTEWTEWIMKNDLNEYVHSLSFEKIMEIIDSQPCLK